MAYTPIGWLNDQAPAINQTNLNKMDNELASLSYANENSSIVLSKLDSQMDSALITEIGEQVSMTSAAGIYNKNGVIQYAQYAQYVHYDVSVSEGELYNVYAYEFSDMAFPFVIFFDGSDNVIGADNDSVGGVRTKQIYVPEGAVRMSINNNTQTAANPAKCWEININNTKEYVDDISEDIHETLLDVLPYEFENVATPSSIPGVLNNNGNPEYAQYERYVHYEYTVSEYEKYKISTYVFGSTNYPAVIAYNASGAIIERFRPTETNKYSTFEYNTPANAVKLAINNDTMVGTINVKKGTPAKIELQSIDSYWKDKKIVWFGTSIPAGVVNAGDEGGNGAYPTRIGEMLGATVYNEAVGSSQVRAGSSQFVTADDPMGYGGCSAPSLMYSLSLSSSEKQEIIDNWDAKWKDIITYYGSQYDPAKATAYKNSSWDIKLAKYLTGGSVGQVDLYVFDHGYNDSLKDYGYTDLSDIPETESDRKYFLGAMQFLIKKILEDNPKAKILFIGHYCTDGRSGNLLTKYVTDAQTKLAEIWQYPFIKTWEYIGFNHQPITVGGVTTTVAQVWMPDDVHPSSDTTGSALKHYAEVLAPLVDIIR